MPVSESMHNYLRSIDLFGQQGNSSNSQSVDND